MKKNYNLDWTEYQVIRSGGPFFIIVANNKNPFQVPHIHLLTNDETYMGVLLSVMKDEFFKDKIFICSSPIGVGFENFDIIHKENYNELMKQYPDLFDFNEMQNIEICQKYFDFNNYTLNIKWLLKNKKYIKYIKFHKNILIEHLKYIGEEISYNICGFGTRIKSLYVNIIHFFEFLKRLIRYIPIIYKDVDFDMHSIYPILRYKLITTRDRIKKDNFIVDTELVVQQIDTALKYLDNYLNADSIVKSPYRENDMGVRFISIPDPENRCFSYMATMVGEEQKTTEWLEEYSKFELDNFNKFWDYFKDNHTKWWD